MKKVNKYLLCSAVVLTAFTGTAREKYGSVMRTETNSQRVMAGCSAPQSSAELTVNNVRTIIFSGGDMWWDLFGGTNAWYYVPKVEDRSIGTSSNFAGNVWFGGLDVGGQLKIGAQTYRQSGIDFWTGPLTTTDASTTLDVCNKYDKIFRMNRVDVDNFILSGGPVTADIKDWPGNGDISLNQDPLLAPFMDVNADGIYTPEAGDYPYYDVYNNAGKDNLGVCKARVFGDQTLWWVYNDNGGVHQATGGKAIGMEVRAQAFAFKTTDEINNMTFYSYEIINRSKFALTQTYMTVWTDADMGYYADDYIGCDVKRGLGYIYNADNFDESVGGVNGYGAYIPALGCDFFQGPINTDDGIDNDGDTLVDELGEQMGMSIFNYHNNNFPGTPIQQTDAQNATQYYQYMTGRWRDGTFFTCGGNAYGGSIPTKYVYPADTYTTGPCGSAPWSELTAGNTPNDRRFMQSAGPFTLKPGATNYITFGLPWARTTSTDASSSIPLLKIADDKAQALFDNCFKVLSGPEAPDMTIQEMNNELLIYFSNKPQSNNYLNQYQEKDVSIIVNPAHYANDNTYKFEGFKVYQLKNQAITQEELIDPSKAKLVFSCDINNGIKRLINYEFDATTGGDVPRVKVEGTDNGLQSTFRFARDEFSLTSDKKVINNKEYYFTAVAYGYNQYGQYKEDTPWSTFGSASSEGQKRPYLEGRKSKRAYGTPHIPDPEKGGTIANSAYGYGPKITRIEGQGNGGNKLDLTQETVDRIVSNGGREASLTYENGRGPINVKVVDPLNVPNTSFAFMFVKKKFYKNAGDALANACVYDINAKLPLSNTTYGALSADSATWVLKDLTTQKEYVPCKSIKIAEEFYFSEIGLSLYVGQSGDVANWSNPALPTDKIVQKGDFIEGTIEFSNPSDRWLSGVSDVDGTNAFNWIRSGQYTGSTAGNDANQNDYEIVPTQTTIASFLDPNQEFEGILNGTWAPYMLCAASKTTATGLANTYAAPGYDKMINATVGTQFTQARLDYDHYDIRSLSSVNVIFTKDKSKWTRSMVLEECDEASANPTAGKKLELRRNRSVDKQGIPTGSPGCNESEAVIDTFSYGCGWFPGYAVNVETGERLNIAFGEDSKQDYNNGRDMIWNPTAEITNQNGYPYSFGGRHYVYIFGNARSSTVYNGVAAGIDGKTIGAGTYSNYVNLVHSYKFGYAFNSDPLKRERILNNLWSDALWVTIPTLSDKRYAFSNPADMPCDAKVRLRVKKAYRPGLSGSFYTGASQFQSALAKTTTVPNSVTSSGYTQLTTDMVATPQNNNFGYYTFNTADIFSEINNGDRAKNSLDLINVVPNPYYAYSTYEKNRTEYKIKITNLPNKCKIKIFTLNGTLIRTFNRDVSGQEDLQITDVGSDYVHSKRISYQDWDLKNQDGIVIASGLYIIHVDVPGVGEKILKWFGVVRPLDLQNY